MFLAQLSIFATIILLYRNSTLFLRFYNIIIYNYNYLRW